MNKWIFTCLSVVSLFFPMKEKELQTYYLESEVIGAKYGIYVDEECQKPVMNEENQAIIIEIKENETKLEYKEESLYLKQVEPADGYYLDEEVYPLQKYTQLHAYPFHIGISFTRESLELELQNEKKEVLKRWKQEKSGQIDYVFQAGKKYSIHAITKEDFLYIKPTVFEIPMMKPQNYELTTYFKLESIPYGSVFLSATDQNDAIIENAKYALFQSDKIVNDVYENATEKSVDEKGIISWDVAEGDYEIRQIEIGDSYYLNPKAVPVKVKSERSQNITISEKKILFQLQMIDSEINKQIQGKIGYEDEQVDSGSFVCLKRNQTYTFSDVLHPKGYYQCEPVSFKVSDVDEEQTSVTLMCQKFQAVFQALDADSKKKIQGGKYQIKTNNGDVVQEFEMINDTFETSDLSDETDYVFHEMNSVNGYTQAKDISFRITKSENNNHVITCEKIPYVVFTQQILDENKNEIRADIGIYTDPLCQQEARDINGNVLNVKRNILLRNGIYYVKIKDLDSHFYKDNSVYKIQLDHTNGIHKIKSVQASSVNLLASVQTEDGNEIDEAEIEVLDQDGNLIKTFSNVRQFNGETSVFERGKAYQIRLHHITGFYTYAKKEQRIQFDEYSPSSVPALQFRCNPYITFHLNGVSNGVYGIYEDERCSVLSRDIYGRSTKKEGSAEWLLRTGTYWLKEVTPPSGCYVNKGVFKIDLSTKQWEEKYEMLSFPVFLKIRITDENNQEIKDSTYEIQEENHTVITTISSSATISGEWLKPGKKLIFHEINAPDGYQSNQTDIMYTIPVDFSSMSPVINITYQKKTNSLELTQQEKNKMKNNRSMDNKKEKSISPFIYLGIACGIFAFVTWKKSTHK